MPDLHLYLSARQEALHFYAPYAFVRPLDHRKPVQQHVITPLLEFGKTPEEQIIPIEVSGETFLFFVKKLPWDTHFFGMDTYRLVCVLYTSPDANQLRTAVSLLIRRFFRTKNQYLFTEIPAEDIELVKALRAGGFRLIETRLKYYCPAALADGPRYRVKVAAEADIASVREVAAQNRNPYDRFHAEPAFTQELADDFLATYAEEAVKGYCDEVLLPDEPNVPSRAFMALKYISGETKLAQVMLSAVSPECRGWHYKLLSECLFRAKISSAHYLLMTTQFTNRAVIRNCEKLRFSPGGVSYIFSHAS